MKAWALDQGVEHYEANDTNGRITFLGDPTGSLTRALDMELTHPGPVKGAGLIGRSKRFALYAVNGEVKYLAVSEKDDDPAGDDDPTITLAPAMMDEILRVRAENNYEL